MLAIYIRSLVLVCFAVLAMRLMGKRQVGQLQPFELVVAIMIADLASTPMESLDIPLWRGIIPLAATITLHQLFTLLSLKSQRMRAFFSGTPTVVIHRGGAAHLWDPLTYGCGYRHYGNQRKTQRISAVRPSPSHSPRYGAEDALRGDSPHTGNGWQGGAQQSAAVRQG